MTIPTPIAALSKTTRLLVTALIEANGKILTWEEMRDAVYGKGKAVGDGNLGQTMKCLAGRAARLLRDNGHPDLAERVVNVRGIGYRWSDQKPKVSPWVEAQARAAFQAMAERMAEAKPPAWDDIAPPEKDTWYAVAKAVIRVGRARKGDLTERTSL